MKFSRKAFPYCRWFVLATDRKLIYNYGSNLLYRYVPGGYFQIRKSGGLNLTSSWEAKFGARSGQVHQIRAKSWKVRSPQDAKVGEHPNFVAISEIQRAKFGAFVTYIFGSKIWGSNKNFRSQFRGQAHRSPDMEVPPGRYVLSFKLRSYFLPLPLIFQYNFFVIFFQIRGIHRL